MNREEALQIVSNEDLFGRLVEINVSRYKETDSYASCLGFLSETDSLQLADTYIGRHRYRSSYFLFFKNDYDHILQLEPSVLNSLHFFLGCCILSCRLVKVVSTAELNIYRQAMGNDIFSFAYFYAMFSPYADDLELGRKLKSEDVTSDNIEEIICKCGDVAFYRMMEKFSSQRLKELLTEKITMSDYYDLSRYFGFSPVKTSEGTLRIFRLTSIFLNNIGIEIL